MLEEEVVVVEEEEEAVEEVHRGVARRRLAIDSLEVIFSTPQSRRG